MPVLAGLLANAGWRRLFAAQVAALVGTGLTTVALALLAYDLAGGDAGRVLGIALALKMVAYVGIAPIAGAYAARLPRKPFLVALDLARAGAVFCLPLVTEVWQIYLLILWLNACSAGFTPTFQATIPEIVPDPAQYSRALSASRLAYDLENLLSPALAAGALMLLSYDALFVANGVGFLASAALILGVGLPGARAGAAGGAWRRTGDGLRAYLAVPELRAVWLLYFAVAAAGALVIVDTVLYVREWLGRGEVAVALAFAASGAGSMLAALALPRWLDRAHERRPMLVGGLLLAVGVAAVAAWQPGFAGLLALWFALGVGLSLVQTPVGRLLTRHSTEADRPALFAAQFALSHACWLAGYPLAGVLASAAGLATAMWVLAAMAAAAAFASWRVWPRADAGG
ncbi:NreB protein [Salinisphaera sp. PC39]|uniref:MFS transporter n=1 Tax=Salinisphaera sp. PC39 TaxID=1304156 RepID=UPI0033412B21